MDDRNSRLPVPVNARPPDRRPALTPSLWQEAAPVVARGAAVVAAGLIGEWLLRSLARNAFSAPRGQTKQRKSKPLVARPEDGLPEGTVAVSETLVVRRRVIVRR